SSWVSSAISSPSFCRMAWIIGQSSGSGRGRITRSTRRLPDGPFHSHPKYTPDAGVRPSAGRQSGLVGGRPRYIGSMRSWSAMILLALVSACSTAGSRAVEPNAAVQVVAPEPVARSLLAELPASIRQEVRYSTPDNFTGAPLPGYGRPLVLLRREAAA